MDLPSKVNITTSPLSHVQVANMVSRELEKECIVVFDEAHNIDNVCIEVSSQQRIKQHSMFLQRISTRVTVAQSTWRRTMICAGPKRTFGSSDGSLACQKIHKHL